MLGNSEDNTALSRALSQLAEVEDKMEQLHQEQAASDFFIFEEMLADYIRLLGAVRVGNDLLFPRWKYFNVNLQLCIKCFPTDKKPLWKKLHKASGSSSY